MRSTRALAPIFLALLLAACGGSGASDDGGGDGPASEAAGTPQPDETTGGGGGGGGNGSSGDLDQLAEDFTPPDSSETSRTTADGVIFVTFESSQSPDQLESFYDDRITGSGLEVFSRTSAEGSYSWLFQDPSDDSFGGVVSVGPSGNGAGSVVVVQVGSGQ